MNIGGGFSVLDGVLVPFVSVASLSIMVVNKKRLNSLEKEMYPVTILYICQLISE
jgi:hypothetical protein